MRYNVNTSTGYLRRYLDKFLNKEVYTWHKIIKFYRIYIAVFLIAASSLFIFFKPMPPKTTFLAIGSEGSSYQIISDAYKSTFKTRGIELELISTNGLGEGLEKLGNNQSPVDASFLTAGVFTGKDFPDLVSLGSIQYAPLWIFYRGPTVKTNDPFEFFSTKKISIGHPGSATNKLYRKLYALNQDIDHDLNTVLELAPKEAAEKLSSGEIDAIFMVDSIASDTVQKLTLNHQIKVMNFPLADAYLKNLDYLSKLTIPKGSLSIKNIWPDEDITILSTTTALLVERDTHPAVQWAYLIAAKDAEVSTNSFFSAPGYFPRNMDVNFPLSPIAKRFYENGTPALFDYFPLWIASALDRTWIYLVAFFLFILPMYNLFSKIRMFPTEEQSYKTFITLRELDEDLTGAHTKEEVDSILSETDNVKKEVYSTWLYGKNARYFFNLKNAISTIKKDASEKLKNL